MSFRIVEEDEGKYTVIYNSVEYTKLPPGTWYKSEYTGQLIDYVTNPTIINNLNVALKKANEDRMEYLGKNEGYADIVKCWGEEYMRYPNTGTWYERRKAPIEDASYLERLYQELHTMKYLRKEGTTDVVTWKGRKFERYPKSGNWYDDSICKIEGDEAQELEGLFRSLNKEKEKETFDNALENMNQKLIDERILEVLIGTARELKKKELYADAILFMIECRSLFVSVGMNEENFDKDFKRFLKLNEEKVAISLNKTNCAV